MDNVTHSLAGLLLAESAVQLRARREGVLPTARFRSVAAISSLIAANLPDADLFYTGAGGDRLAYMLQHRGYTHTVLLAVIGGVLVWGVAMLGLRRGARKNTTSGDGNWLFWLLVGSTLSHIGLDWTNSYGVHPFWPIDNRWVYGDAVFIVEPWLWIVTVPTLVAAATGRIGRATLSLVMVIGLAAAWRVDLVSRGAAIALTIGALFSIGVARLLSSGARAAVSVAAWAGVTIAMAAGSAVVRSSVVRAVRAVAPNARILDIVVSPLPANAVCMSVISLELSGGMYRVSTARASAFPLITAASSCGRRDAGGVMRPSARASTPSVQWDREWSAPVAELVRLAQESCPALAALRFIRAPIWLPAGDSAALLGDVRYGSGSGGGFTDVTVHRAAARCSFAVPPWTPPRSDLLDERLSR